MPVPTLSPDVPLELEIPISTAYLSLSFECLWESQPPCKQNRVLGLQRFLNPSQWQQPSIHSIAQVPNLWSHWLLSLMREAYL